MKPPAVEAPLCEGFCDPCFDGFCDSLFDGFCGPFFGPFDRSGPNWLSIAGDSRSGEETGAALPRGGLRVDCRCSGGSIPPASPSVDGPPRSGWTPSNRALRPGRTPSNRALRLGPPSRNSVSTFFLLPTTVTERKCKQCPCTESRNPTHCSIGNDPTQSRPRRRVRRTPCRTAHDSWL